MRKNAKGSRHAMRWSRAALLAVMGLYLLLSSAFAAPAGNSDDLKVVVGDTVEITTSRRYCWFPTVHKFASGEIMATMRMSPDEINPEGNFSAYCISKDGGKTWGPRYTMGAGANVDGAYSDARPDGTIWQLYGWVDSLDSGPTDRLRMTLTKFSRGGMEFTQSRDVPLRTAQPVHIARTDLFDRRIQDGHLSTQPIYMPWGPIIDALNGDLLAPVYYTAEADQRYYHLSLIRSSDGGKSWSEFSTIADVKPGEPGWPNLGKEGPCETGLVRLADNRLYAIYRTGGNGFIGNSWSNDDGKTWTTPVSIPYKGVALRVRRLSNGVLACTTGRPGPVVVMFSVDGTGEKWTHITPIFNGQSTHYTDLIEVEPGKLLVVYDSVPYNWEPIPASDEESRNIIFGTFVTVEAQGK